ncbi:uncharacterized protein [Palaemon carinicauda]|uniref:uncharacterized protein n=1 Tax=Palaemon carinicauda TaxID=392227 RepID=UPI0035B5F0EF
MPILRKRKENLSPVTDLDLFITEIDTVIQGKEGKKMTGASMQVNVADEECDDRGNQGRCGHYEVYVEFGIQCDECRRWYHDEEACSNLRDGTSDIFQSRNIIYKCPRCLETANPNG